MLRMFPELVAGLHLDRYARVLAVHDAPKLGDTSERFRPRFAVDLEILTPEGVKDEAYAVYEAVPLPAMGAVGTESGQYAFPVPGTLVVMGFAYGRPDHPVIRQLYPQGCSLPDLPFGAQRWQQDAAVFQTVDPDGNWQRKTDMTITDESLQHVRRTVEAIDEFARELRMVAEHSTEEVGGIKTIEALGALKLLTGGVANFSAGGSVNITTARDLRQLAAENRREATGKDHQAIVKGNRDFTVNGSATDKIDGSYTETVGGDHAVTVKGKRTEAVTGQAKTTAQRIELLAPLIRMGSGDVSVLPTIINFMEETRDALKVLATHTHPTTAQIVQGSTVSGHATNIGGLRDDLDSISG